MNLPGTVLLSETRASGERLLHFAQSGRESLEFEMRRGAFVVGRLVFSSERGESAAAGPTGREWILERSGSLGPFVTAWRSRRGGRRTEAIVRPDGWGGASIRTSAGHALTWVRGRGCGSSTILRASDGLPVLRYEIATSGGGGAVAGSVGLKEAGGLVKELPVLAPLGLFLAVLDWTDSPNLGLGFPA